MAGDPLQTAVDWLIAAAPSAFCLNQYEPNGRNVFHTA